MALDEVTLASASPHRSRSRGPLRAVTYPFRFFFRLFKRSLAGILRLIGYHPASSAIIVILLAAVAFLGYQDYGAGVGLGGRAAADNNVLPPSPAAENFIKGQMTFDAGLMWQSFSDDFKQQLAQRGTNQQSIQRQLDQRKQSGGKIDDVRYVGGVQTVNGDKVFMYVLTTEAPGNQGVAESHYVLTVDQNDKIINVE